MYNDKWRPRFEYFASAKFFKIFGMSKVYRMVVN
jgi:hypothetical protein